MKRIESPLEEDEEVVVEEEDSLEIARNERWQH